MAGLSACCSNGGGVVVGDGVFLETCFFDRLRDFLETCFFDRLRDFLDLCLVETRFLDLFVSEWCLEESLCFERRLCLVDMLLVID